MKLKESWRKNGLFFTLAERGAEDIRTGEQTYTSSLLGPFRVMCIVLQPLPVMEIGRAKRTEKMNLNFKTSQSVSIEPE